TLRAFVPERHAHPRYRVKHLEPIDGFLSTSNIPERQLTVAHPREASCGDSIMLTHPYGAAVLGSSMARTFMSGLFLSRVPYSQFLVSRSRDQERAIGAP